MAQNSPAGEREIVIALAGNPNAGKTSLFNRLTGARAHVGNYPGVTVERREGVIEHGGRRIRVVDLPGTYSLTPYSLEELVARDYILNERPDVVVDVVDAVNLERNLYLAVQFMEIGIPVVIALNMIDMLESRGLRVDVDRLSALLGTPVVPTVARAGQGVEPLLDAVVASVERGGRWESRNIRYGPDIDEKINEIEGILSGARFGADRLPQRWMAVKILEGDSQVLGLLDADPERAARVRSRVDEVTRHLKATFDDEPAGVIADHRYGFINSITKQAVTVARDLRRTITDRLDMVALNRLVGPLILLAVLYGLYQFVFWASSGPLEGTGVLFGWLGDAVSAVLPEGPLQSLVVSGIIDGMGGVLGFVPLIGFMFLGIAVLEDSGYMARIAFIMDRVLRTFGLHGSSVLALIVGGGISGGCAVPGVMAARTLRDPKERLATILVTPFMNCGAKLPVYAVLIAAFFPAGRARMLFLLTIISWGLALTAARILRWTVLRGAHTPFVMELPPYRMPTLQGLLIHTWERIWQYIKKAGTVILAISVLMWAAMSYPTPPDTLTAVFDHQEKDLTQKLAAATPGTPLAEPEGIEAFQKVWDERGSEAPDDTWQGLTTAASRLAAGESVPDADAAWAGPAAQWLRYQEDRRELAEARASATLRHSIAGRLGTLLETVSHPLGFDWRVNIALVGGFAAKEVVVSTLGTAYSLGGDMEEDLGLAQRLAQRSGWNALTAFVLMLFVMMYSPCLVTLVVIGREAGWRWSMFALTYTTGAAYVLCLVVHTAGKALGLGV